MKIVAAALLFVGTVAPAATATLGDISPGAIFGILATWLGIGIGYTTLRRSIKRDALEQMQAVAEKKAHEVFNMRGQFYMDRGRQEEINAKNDERFAVLSAMNALAAEIRGRAQVTHEGRRMSDTQNSELLK